MKTRLKTYSVDLSNIITAKKTVQAIDTQLKTHMISLKGLITKIQISKATFILNQKIYQHMKQTRDDGDLFQHGKNLSKPATKIQKIT